MLINIWCQNKHCKKVKMWHLDVYLNKLTKLQQKCFKKM